MDKIQNDLSEIFKNINDLQNNTKDLIILEKMIIDLEFIYKKYDKKINPKYYKKINIKNINLLFYESGINILLKNDFNESIFWDIIKIIIRQPSFTCIKLRKDKDFSTSVVCTSKSFSKIKLWFTNNTLDYETLSLFFVTKDKEIIEKYLEELNK